MHSQGKDKKKRNGFHDFYEGMDSWIACGLGCCMWFGGGGALSKEFGTRKIPMSLPTNNYTV